MISQYYESDKSFDSLKNKKIEIEELQKSNSDYWYLNTKDYPGWIWKNDIFNDLELNHIRMIGQALCMERATTGKNSEDCLDHRRSMVSWIPINDHTSWIYERLTSHIKMVNEKWFDFDLDKIERLQFTHYNCNENGCYKAHVDPLQWNIPHNRKLSIVVQLSDPSEYEGGELILHNSHENNVIEKEKGHTVFFPSYTLHEVTPVTKGERFTLVGWIHGNAFR